MADKLEKDVAEIKKTLAEMREAQEARRDRAWREFAEKVGASARSQTPRFRLNTETGEISNVRPADE